MAMVTVGKLPGKKDINNQYSRGSVKQSLKYYNEIKDPKTGDYKFGELTNKWYNNPQWMKDVGVYPKDAQAQIKGYVIEALTNKTNGQDDPIPFLITWTDDNSGVKSVTRTYDPFTIQIVNYPPPPSSALDERKQKE
jgi:hypothetical protein